MTREEAANLLDHYCYGNTNILRECDDELAEKIQTAMDEAIAALRGPQPDPKTGLVPCGCGGKVDVAFYPGWHGGPDRYHVDCFNCHVGTRPCQTAEQAKASWNTAMGWKGGAE